MNNYRTRGKCSVCRKPNRELHICKILDKNNRNIITKALCIVCSTFNKEKNGVVLDLALDPNLKNNYESKE